MKFPRFKFQGVKFAEALTTDGRVMFRGPKEQVKKNAKLWNQFLGRGFKKTDEIVEIKEVEPLEAFLEIDEK